MEVEANLPSLYDILENKQFWLKKKKNHAVSCVYWCFETLPVLWHFVIPVKSQYLDNMNAAKQNASRQSGLEHQYYFYPVQEICLKEAMWGKKTVGINHSLCLKHFFFFFFSFFLTFIISCLKRVLLYFGQWLLTHVLAIDQGGRDLGEILDSTDRACT